mmetsp:Transcript_15528/g.48531  ORF Transcript_15528/g.48531 Transcript_15528/m.48531 type:complete len:427 (-) Transcript_15528:69-1349(-)
MYLTVVSVNYDLLPNLKKIWCSMFRVFDSESCPLSALPSAARQTRTRRRSHVTATHWETGTGATATGRRRAGMRGGRWGHTWTWTWTGSPIASRDAREAQAARHRCYMALCALDSRCVRVWRSRCFPAQHARDEHATRLHATCPLALRHLAERVVAVSAAEFVEQRRKVSRDRPLALVHAPQVKGATAVRRYPQRLHQHLRHVLARDRPLPDGPLVIDPEDELPLAAGLVEEAARVDNGERHAAVDEVLLRLALPQQDVATLRRAVRQALAPERVQHVARVGAAHRGAEDDVDRAGSLGAVDLRLLAEPIDGLRLAVREAKDGAARRLVRLSARRRLGAGANDESVAAGERSGDGGLVGDVGHGHRIGRHTRLDQRRLALLAPHNPDRLKLGQREQLPEGVLPRLAASAGHSDAERVQWPDQEQEG